jgi:hypothetical protein
MTFDLLSCFDLKHRVSPDEQSSDGNMKKRITKILLGAGVVAFVLVVTGAGLWYRAVHRYGRAEMEEIVKDVRAGLAARHIRNPQVRVEAFLEARYGPLTDPANREKALLGFFDADHIKALSVIVSHTPARQRQANTQAMANWIAHYRETMTPNEQADLQSRLDSQAGQAMLQHATSQYLSEDVYYRGNQKPVVGELIATLAALKKR